MYSALYEYLLHHKKLAVPGIGTFLLVREPAVIDFPERQIHAPRYAINLEEGEVTVSRKFFHWLSAILHIPELDAIRRFNDFVFDLKKDLGSGNLVRWKGIGHLQKGEDGRLLFKGVEARAASIPAEKVIRENAAHSVRVGETERTSAEMTALLHTPQKRSRSWWLLPLLLGLLAISFLVVLLSRNGWQVNTLSCSKKAVISGTTSTYTMMP
jgi:hypothetical protein